MNAVVQRREYNPFPHRMLYCAAGTTGRLRTEKINIEATASAVADIAAATAVMSLPLRLFYPSERS